MGTMPFRTNFRVVYVRITEKRRLATAAAAIKQRIVNRKRPLEFLPVALFMKGSKIVLVIVGVDDEKLSTSRIWRTSVRNNERGA
jgi:hypothetical protein